jgi:hypothetical protein
MIVGVGVGVGERLNDGLKDVKTDSERRHVIK